MTLSGLADVKLKASGKESCEDIKVAEEGEGSCAGAGLAANDGGRAGGGGGGSCTSVGGGPSICLELKNVDAGEGVLGVSFLYDDNFKNVIILFYQ